MNFLSLAKLMQTTLSMMAMPIKAVMLLKKVTVSKDVISLNFTSFLLSFVFTYDWNFIARKGKHHGKVEQVQDGRQERDGVDQQLLTGSWRQQE